MKEKERLEVVNRIKIDVSESDILLSKKKQLSQLCLDLKVREYLGLVNEINELELMNTLDSEVSEREFFIKKRRQLKYLIFDENVRKYLELSKEIRNLERKLGIFKGNLDKMINFEFNRAFKLRISSNNFDLCSHDVWFYNGSYGAVFDPYWSCDLLVCRNTEGFNEFEYNSYVCLECGSEVKISNWQQFEDTHLVLKTRYDYGKENGYSDMKDIYSKKNDGYRQMYYRFLYDSSSEESINRVINQFGRALKKTKK